MQKDGTHATDGLLMHGNGMIRSPLADTFELHAAALGTSAWRHFMNGSAFVRILSEYYFDKSGRISQINFQSSGQTWKYV